MTIILGIDPGSRKTGYGIIKRQGSELLHLANGHINTNLADVAERLHTIFSSLCDIIEKYKPHSVSIEQIFTCRNPQSALKLGQARGAALVAAAKYALDIHEYSAKQVKQAVVGYGGASKDQVQHMIKLLFKLKQSPQADAADALAIAVCHCHSHRLKSLLDKA